LATSFVDGGGEWTERRKIGRLGLCKRCQQNGRANPNPKFGPGPTSAQRLHLMAGSQCPPVYRPLHVRTSKAQEYILATDTEHLRSSAVKYSCLARRPRTALSPRDQLEQQNRQRESERGATASETVSRGERAESACESGRERERAFYNAAGIASPASSRQHKAIIFVTPTVSSL
jgi:hypothetical protein